MTTVDLSVGHGVKPDGTYDPGAAGGGTDEQRAGDVVTSACAGELRRHDVATYSEADRDRRGDDPNFPGSVDRINRSTKPRVAATFHHDWSGAPDGFFVHWFPGSAEGERAADLIADEVRVAGFGIRESWHRARDLYFVRETRCPAVLIECGRIGEYDDAELARMGRAVAHGLLAWLGIRVKPDAPRKPSEAPAYRPATGARYVHLPRVRRGAVDGPVPRVQALLLAAGHRPGPLTNDDGAPDGDFGPGTDRELRAFQAHRGIAEDGEVGPVTWERLIEG